MKKLLIVLGCGLVLLGCGKVIPVECKNMFAVYDEYLDVLKSANAFPNDISKAKDQRSRFEREIKKMPKEEAINFCSSMKDQFEKVNQKNKMLRGFMRK